MLAYLTEYLNLNVFEKINLLSFCELIEDEFKTINGNLLNLVALRIIKENDMGVSECIM